MFSLLKSYALSAVFGGAGLYVNSWQSYYVRLVMLIIIGLIVTTWQWKMIRREYARQIERRVTRHPAQALMPRESPDPHARPATR